jgi:hypothetical protein
MTIKAIAVKDGLTTSDVSTFSYELLPEAGSLDIYDIQGAQHVSPYEGQLVREVPGIVTHVETNGFYFQSETGDGDINTSDAVHVYARGHDVSVGDFVEVTGEVVEYAEAGYDDNDDLTTTQIEATFVDVLSQDNALPEAFVIGMDREIPSVPFVDFESYNPLDPSMFDASVNAIDYMESLEAMYVEIPGQVTVTGPQKYGELTVVSEAWNLDNRTPSGGVYLEASTQGDFAPEMITEVLFVNVSESTVAKTGDYFIESIEGIVGYNFGNFKIEPTVDGLPTLNDGDNTRRNETMINFAEDKLTVASYNVENFSPEESEAKANKLAESMANELNTPDILGLVEVMDSYGTEKGPNTSAHESYQIFIDKIFDLTGVEYAYTEVAPVQGQDGGIPGGNIRVGYLYRTDRVELKQSSVGAPTEAVTVNADGSLNVGTGRIDPTNTAFDNSRKSLVAEFVFKGESVFVIGNHWNSKRGDLAPYGVKHPAEQGSRIQRLEIANVIGDFIADLQAKNNNEANVVVLGDFNDYPWSPPIETVSEKGNLYNAIYNLPRESQYTYTYNGYSQSLDSILVSQSLKEGMAVDVMNINSEFMEKHGRASDHDPIMVQVTVPNIDPNYEISPAPTMMFVDEVLNEDPSIVITEGDNFSYPDVTAEDFEGNVLDVTRKGDDVDTAVLGTYVVSYETMDANGKTASLRLTVEVKADYDVNDMSVSEAIMYNEGTGTVRGYIVGSMASLEKDGSHPATNLVIADTIGETDKSKLLPVQLPSGSAIRENLNLLDNPDMYNQEVMITGSLEAYFSKPGLKSPTAYTLVSDDTTDETPEVSYEAMSIADFRNLATGETGEITGVITTVPGSCGGSRFAIQDETAGIYVNYSDDTLAMGDEVTLRGERGAFNGEVQISAVEHELLVSDVNVPAPRVSAISDITKADEGQILTIENVEITAMDVQSYDTFEFIAVNGEESFTVRVDNRTRLDAINFSFVEGDIVNVTGLIAEYNGTLQIKPRFKEDIVAAQ